MSNPSSPGGSSHQGTKRRFVLKRVRRLNNNGQQERPVLPNNLPNLNISEINISTNCPYYGWKLYFDEKEYSRYCPLIKKIEAAKGFLERNKNNPMSLDGRKAGFNVDVERLYKDNTFLKEWSNFQNELRDAPRETLNCLGLAFHQLLVKSLLKSYEGTSIEQLPSVPMIRVKVSNYQHTVSLTDLKIHHYGQLIVTRGFVIRVGRVRHLFQWIDFACNKCNFSRLGKQPNGIYTLPQKCDICGPAKFSPQLDSPDTTSIPFQTVRLQEHPSEGQDDKGKMPRSIDVELMDDLVQSCMPGDDVTVVGIIRLRGTDDGKSKTKVNTVSGCPLYIEAVSIKNNKSKSDDETELGIEFSVKDYYAIKEIHKTPDVFSLLVRSLCPNIYGHENVKAGLLLSLFGGSPKHASLRDDIHVLMVGDPGLGKSQMLRACTRVAPKAVYVCGNASSCSGLTVTLTREPGTSDFALEPGALVLADRGCCIIDEFDKMRTQHRALLEAMEQQSVSVAKAGVVCSLPARTTILAAANPIGGSYNESKTLIQNLNMSEPLLSRFDLVFLLLDQPDEIRDGLMCAHVMNTYVRGNKDAAESANGTQAQSSSAPVVATKTATPRDRLSLLNAGTKDLIPQPIIRKYIAYARRYVQPTLSPAAAAILQDYYLELRKRNTLFGSMPVCNRQLEALIRLAEARAKLELRVEVTVSDATDVVDLLKCTLDKIPPDAETTRNVSSDAKKITASKVTSFIALLRAEIEANYTKLFSKMDLMEIAEKGEIIVQDFSRFIARLCKEGVLSKRGKLLYKFVKD